MKKQNGEIIKGLRSKCCKAQVKITGTGLTHYYFCTSCGNPCDLDFKLNIKSSPPAPADEPKNPHEKQAEIDWAASKGSSFSNLKAKFWQQGSNAMRAYWKPQVEALESQLKPVSDKPKVICLCGSTRFGKAFQEAQIRLTLEGKIFHTIGCNMRSDTELFGQMPPDELKRIKVMLDELHKRKIDLSDEILVLNVGGYIGESTRSEIEYAEAHGKPVKYLEALASSKGEGK